MALRFALATCLVAVASIARAQPSDILRDGNAAAAAGDWARVTALVTPLLGQPLAAPDRAEAHRLAGIAAFYQQRTAEAEQHFLEYLKIELDGRLDPSLYQPDVVTFFNDVSARHQAQLRARRPKPKRYFVLNFVPMAGQFQNGERTKGWIVGGTLGVLAIANVTSYFLLRSWCDEVSGPEGSSFTCDKASHASTTGMRVLNVASGIGLIVTYVYGVYDGVAGYRRRSREYAQPFISPSQSGAVVGLQGSF